MTKSERDVRISKKNQLQKRWITPYAPKFKKLDRVDFLLEKREQKQNMWLLRDISDILIQPIREISLAGRLVLYRSHGKLSFGKLLDETWEIQVMRHQDQCKLLKNRVPHKVNKEFHALDATVKTWRRQIVKMVIINDEWNIIVSHVSSSDNYSLPWWWVDEWDNLYDAVHREALEETWYTVKVIEELPKIHEYLKKRKRHQMAYGFLCKTIGEPQLPEFVESEILDWFSMQVLSIDEFEQKLLHQIANPTNDPDREQLDGIFKRDLILIQKAKEILAKTVHLSHDNPERYMSIQEISPYQLLEKYIDVWDFIGIKWELFTTHKGEPTIFVSEYQLLSKAIRPLGDKFHGIWENQENAYRQRYLDMIFNRDTLNRFKLRSKFLKTLRDFYHEQWFIEIETPILWHSASWAAAQPFVAKHLEFDTDMYLRISPETNLKKSTVGMLEKVFEVAKNFRNEWSDPSHHQEFTMIEHYAAYRNYEDNMRFTEHMFDYIFDKIPQLSKIVDVTDKDWVTKSIDFATPWPRIDYITQVKNDSGIDVSAYQDSDTDKLRADIIAWWHTRVGIEHQSVPVMIDYLYKKVTRPKIVWPAFVVNYPATMQPLARKSDLDSDIVEQWQLVIHWREVVKSYSELVDPIQQQSNFDAQLWAIAAWDTEATKSDYDFVMAMEYGMPPQSGRGMWIDRIFALLTQQSNIRDVIMFPMMKKNNDTSKQEPDHQFEDPNLDTKPSDYIANNPLSDWNTLNSTATSPNGAMNIPLSLSDTQVTQAQELVKKYTNDTYWHLVQVAWLMRYFAGQLWYDQNYWYVVWLLHDIDRDYIHKDATKHVWQEMQQIVSQLEYDTTMIDQIIIDIKSHAPGLSGVQPQTTLQKYLISIDELSGLMHAYSRMRGWFVGMEPAWVLKKIKDKSFAAGVDREHVRNCEIYLNISLEEFVEQMIKAFQNF